MRRLLVGWIVLWMVPGVLAQDGKLEAVRQEVRTPSSDSPKSSSSSSSSSFCDDDDLNLLMAKCFFYVVTSPYTVPYFTTCDSYVENKSVFLAYPYADKWSGIMHPEKSITSDCATPSSWNHLTSLRASVEEGNDFHRLNRLGFNFLADSMLRLGVGGSVQLYEEKQRTNSPDQLVIGDINALFRFAQGEHVQFRSGLGLRFLNDSQRTDLGFNFVYGMELFPIEPWTFGAQFEAGTLGNATVIRATTRLGVNWKRLEAYLGYDYLRIGSTALQGPMVGLRLWF